MAQSEFSMPSEACRRILDLGNDLISVYDEKGNCVYVSPTISNILGYSAQELIGKPGLDIVHPDDVLLARELFSQVIQNPGETFRGDLRVRHKNGDSIILNYRVTNLLHDPQVNSIITNQHDVSAQRIIERQLRESEQKYATLVEQGNDGIVIVQDGLVRYANKILYDLLGYTPGELVDSPFVNYIAPEYQELVAERFTKRLRGEEVPALYEFTIIAKDGRHVPVEVNAAVIDYQGKPADMGIVRDITERKETGKKLMEAKATTEVMLNATTDLIALFNLGGLVIECNEPFAQSIGKKREDLIGMHGKDFLPPQIYKERLAYAFKTLEEKRPVTYMDTRDSRWFETRQYPVLDEHGEVRQVAFYIRDVTEEKQLRERLQEQEKLAALGRIAAVISHELNTPLSSIDLIATMLSETLPARYHDDINTIKQEIKQASQLVKETLGFSRMESLNLQPTHIKPILEIALKHQQNLHNNTVITYETDITNALIMADKDKLRLAVENIIKNAVQAQKTPSTVHNITITTQVKNDDDIIIIIHDTGTGMDDHTKNNLFKAFYTTREKAEGTGLGLYITEWIIKNHEGTITATSDKEKGTSIIITLPIHKSTT